VLENVDAKWIVVITISAVMISLIVAYVSNMVTCTSTRTFRRNRGPTQRLEGTVHLNHPDNENGMQMDEIRRPISFNGDSPEHIYMEVDELQCNSPLLGE
jgi:hypothetical protein